MTAEEILKSKLDMKIAIVNNPDYTFNKVIEAMEEYAEQRMKTINERVLALESQIRGIAYVDENDDDDDDGRDDDFYEEQREQELMERGANCTCGAWQLNKSGTQVVHVADCCCGA